MLNIENITAKTAQELCQKITKELPQYFGLPDANAKYFNEIGKHYNLSAKLDSEHIGLVAIEFPYPNNASIYWLGILPTYFNRDIGTQLVAAACKYVLSKNARTITVETLAPQNADINYLKTYNFYKKLGFLPMYNQMPESYEWEMVYMVKVL